MLGWGSGFWDFKVYLMNLVEVLNQKNDATVWSGSRKLHFLPHFLFAFSIMRPFFFHS